MSELGWNPPVPGLPVSTCGAAPPAASDGWSVYWHDLYHPTFDHGSYGRFTGCGCSTAWSSGTQADVMADAESLKRRRGRGRTQVVVRNGSRVVERWP